MTWQPIDTAPDCETECLLYFSPSGHIEDARMWNDDEGFRYILFDGGNINQNPTHWMPLPPTPEDV